MSDTNDRERSRPERAKRQPANQRPKYRDNDDVRDPRPPDDRSESRPDSRFEARGDARENVGNTARGTAAEPSGPAGNDKTRRRDRDQGEDFDGDLA